MGYEYKPYTQDGEQTTSVNKGDKLSLDVLQVPKNGYVYICVTNSSNGITVYNNNFQISHTYGHILEENHYYPFGLKIAALSSSAVPDLNDGETKNLRQYQADFSEFDEDLGWNDFALRNYDPQIGRWIQQDPYDEYASPYVGMGNDPVNNMDEDGGGTGILNDIYNLGAKIFSGSPSQTACPNNVQGNSSGAFSVPDGVEGAFSAAANWEIASNGFETINNANAVNQYNSANFSGRGADDGIRSTNWTSMGTDVHQHANSVAVWGNTDDRFKDIDLFLRNKTKISALNAATKEADKKDNQKPNKANMHAMRFGTQTVDEAKKQADIDVRKHLNEAKRLLKEGKTYDAYFEFGLGLHTFKMQHPHLIVVFNCGQAMKPQVS